MCSERVEWSKALEAEAPLLGAEAGAGREDAAAAACRSAGRGDAASAPLDAAARGGPAHQAKDHADIHLALAILSNLKGAGVGAGGSLGDDSSGLGLETPSGSASSCTSASAAPDDFSAAPSSEGDEDEDDDDEEEEEHDATERTPLHAARPALAVAIVPAKQAAPDAEATAVPESPRSTASQGAPRARASSNRSSSSSGSSGRTTYSGDLEAGGDPAAAKGKVPDGGWGWVVVAASFVMSMIADGISFSFGLLFVRFLAHFEDSRSKTSWIGSLFMSVPLMSGPLGSALVDRYGCRTMTIVGGLVSALGFVLSAVANSIEMLIVTFGVIAGLGLGLCYVTCVVSIAFWFDKRRALATGLAAAGTGFGTFVYAPLTNLFLVEYGWRGALLLLAGTLLHMCVCGAVMRDPDWWVAEQAKAARAEAKAAEAAAGAGGVSTGSSCGGGASLDGGGGDPGLEEARRMLKMGRSPEYVLAALAANGHGPAHPHGGLANGHCCSSVLNLPTFVRQDESVPVEVLEKLSTNQRVLRAVLDKCPSLFPARSLSDSGPLAALPPPPPPSAPNGTGPARARGGSDRRPQAATPGALGALALPSLKRARCGVAQPSHYLKGIRVHRNSVMYRGAMLNIHKYKLRASSCPDIFRNSMTTIAQEQEEHWYSDMLTLLRGMTDFSLFAELHFTLMQLSTVLLFIWFIVPYFYLADYMTENNYTETEASWLLSIIGITNTIGIVGLGWAGDQPWVNVPKTFAGCLVLCGLSALAMPLCKENFFALAFASGLFGLFFASSFSFTPVILVQLVPLEKFTTAYGLVLLCQGIGNLIGPPVGGWLYDVTKTYDLSFYLTGIWIVVSGLLIAVIPMTKNHRLWGTSITDKEKEIKEADQVSCA
ncbi:hypothetical protein R5R35_000897 [Gryllus longicercus]|uniref:Major facilitator superfamily (MFS) profile domain-containing protein n=1 Tax=Gryllus longicercus TaxID=2509291 RepID=A0AAN9VT69_9ORTH